MSATPLELLLQSGRAHPVDAGTLASFLARPGPALLLFTGDVAQRPEAQDVAVVAGELARHVDGLDVGVVTAAAEGEVRPRFHVEVVPTVVFLRDGRAVSTLARVQEWAAYARTASVVFGRNQKKEAAS